MLVKVTKIPHGFQLDFQGNQEVISNPGNQPWNRWKATEALNVLAKIYGANRKRVRFEFVN